MAIKVAAKGNGPNTGAPGFTPAPRPVAPDVISNARAGGDGYGQNSGAKNPSSVPPGKSVTSPLGMNLKASSDDGENVLDHVIANGTRMDSADFQTRAVSDKQAVPTSWGNRSRRGEV
jgi:hypothetical protein